MAKDFYTRLRSYYLKVGEVLRGEADAASVFANTSDVGTSREFVYAAFLRQHAPSRCNVFLGGFLFHEDGTESKQLDVIVTTDTTPRFDFHNKDGGGKAFSPVEGTVAVASIKSTLDKKQLFDALDNIASIPEMTSLEGRIPFIVTLDGYEDWPYKIIFASDGIEGQKVLDYVNEYYRNNPAIPLHRRPNIIHVAGRYVISRLRKGMSFPSGDEIEIGEFHFSWLLPDLQGILWAVMSIQQNVASSTHISYSYTNVMNNVLRAENAD